MATTVSSRIQKFLEKQGKGFQFDINELKEHLNLTKHNLGAITGHISRMKSIGAIKVTGKSATSTYRGRKADRYEVQPEMFMSTRESPRKNNSKRGPAKAKKVVHEKLPVVAENKTTTIEAQLSELFLDIASKFEQAEVLYRKIREQNTLSKFSNEELIQELSQRFRGK